MEQIQLANELEQSFHQFWDKFPFPVMLLHKNRTILACNPAAKATGCSLGTRCIDRGELTMHQGCLANAALREQAGKRSVQFVKELGLVMDSFWIPVVGHEDLYVHFGIDITPYAADRVMQLSCTEPTGDCGGCSCKDDDTQVK